MHLNNTVSNSIKEDEEDNNDSARYKSEVSELTSARISNYSMMI